MPGFDFPLRAKLALWAALGVLLVAGMLIQQQIGDRSAARQRALAESKQFAAVEALRANKDIGNMRVETARNPACHGAERHRSRA